MKHRLLTVLSAIMLAILGCGCSDDPEMVDAVGMKLEYRHVDFEKLPQPVQDAITSLDKNVANLSYIIKGTFNEEEAYMYDFMYSSSTIGRTITSDGTNIPFEEIKVAVEAGRLRNWVCVYHHKYDWNTETPDLKD